MMKNGNKSGECVHPPFSWLEELAHHPFLFVVFSISLSADFPFFFLFFLSMYQRRYCAYSHVTPVKKKEEQSRRIPAFQNYFVIEFFFFFSSTITGCTDA